MKNKKKFYVIMSVLVVAIIIMSIAYSTLSTNIKVNFGTVKQLGQTWSVSFVPGTYNATAAGTSGTGRVCGTVTVASGSPTFATVADTQLSKPGDRCTWELTIKNTGSIGAYLKSFTATQPSGYTNCTISSAKNQMVCGAVLYKITSDAAGANLLPVTTTTVGAGSTLKVYLIAAYNGNDLLTSAVTQKSAKFSLVFEQK